MCNLRCHYCFYHDEAKNREVESYGFMSEETLENVIRKALDYSDTACSFTYQGGEPFLRGLDFYRKAVVLQKKYNAKGLHISNAIQTNGTCLDEKWAEFLKENNFLVGISLDGTGFIHDRFRVDGQGEGSFAAVHPLPESDREGTGAVCVYAYAKSLRAFSENAFRPVV